MIVNFNDHAANERTFLTWVRTAMALVAFGLAMSHISGARLSRERGLILVLSGIVVVALASIRMHHMMRRIDGAESYPYATGRSGVLL